MTQSGRHRPNSNRSHRSVHRLIHTEAHRVGTPRLTAPKSRPKTSSQEVSSEPGAFQTTCRSGPTHAAHVHWQGHIPTAGVQSRRWSDCDECDGDSARLPFGPGIFGGKNRLPGDIRPETPRQPRPPTWRCSLYRCVAIGRVYRGHRLARKSIENHPLRQRPSHPIFRPPEATNTVSIGRAARPASSE